MRGGARPGPARCPVAFRTVGGGGAATPEGRHACPGWGRACRGRVLRLRSARQGAHQRDEQAARDQAARRRRLGRGGRCQGRRTRTGNRHLGRSFQYGARQRWRYIAQAAPTDAMGHCVVAAGHSAAHTRTSIYVRVPVRPVRSHLLVSGRLPVPVDSTGTGGKIGSC